MNEMERRVPGGGEDLPQVRQVHVPEGIQVIPRGGGVVPPGGKIASYVKRVEDKRVYP